jgi:hypothetical protein
MGCSAVYSKNLKLAEKIQLALAEKADDGGKFPVMNSL